jgi:Zn-dependent protease with chaperone function
MVSKLIDQWLGTFHLDGWIRDHVAAVLENLPDEVRADLMDDPEFVVCDFEPGPNAVLEVPVRFSGGGKPGRSIVLKRTIKLRPTPFARWVIAHELAHAYLRHGGRWPAEDPEHAADSLAAAWGFPNPRTAVSM